MAIEIATKEDWEQFKSELLSELQDLLKNHKGGMKPLLTATEVRKLLGGMSIGTLQTLRNNGVLPFYKIGGKTFYHMDDIMKVLEASKVQQESKNTKD